MHPPALGEKVNHALEGAQDAVANIFRKSCEDAGGLIGGAGSAAWLTGKGLVLTGEEEKGGDRLDTPRIWNRSRYYWLGFLRRSSRGGMLSDPTSPNSQSRNFLR